MVPSGVPIEVTADVAYLRTAIVNVAFIGQPGLGDRGWTLVDAGIPGCAPLIRQAAAARFGPGNRPAAIVMTHGHFDHVGALEELAAAWEVPIYAHRLEFPYLDGRSPYPPPDPSVGGGMMARLSWLYPRGPIDVGGRLLPLSEDGTIPPLPGWRWVHTPGHTAGHVSFFRDHDRTLIAGDAFVTVKQESALAVMSQRPEMHGPPAYYTTDWAAAGDSVRTLALLEPEAALTGHGVPLYGEELRGALHALARDFERVAVPADGRYVRRPAIADENGVAYVPPDPSSPWPRLLAGAGAGVAVGLAAAALWRGTRGRRRRVEPDLDAEVDLD
jgi:glyoxylase-like metal-dependent hydrolase (beta-lactamase superfamily II)